MQTLPSRGQNAAITLTSVSVLVGMTEHNFDDLVTGSMMATLGEEVPRLFAKADKRPRQDEKALRRIPGGLPALDAVADQLYSSDNRNGEFPCGQARTTIPSSSPPLAPAPALGSCCGASEDDHRSLVIEKRGTPKAGLLSLRDYVRLAGPEPQVLRVLG